MERQRTSNHWLESLAFHQKDPFRNDPFPFTRDVKRCCHTRCWSLWAPYLVGISAVWKSLFVILNSKGSRRESSSLIASRSFVSKIADVEFRFSLWSQRRRQIRHKSAGPFPFQPLLRSLHLLGLARVLWCLLALSISEETKEGCSDALDRKRFKPRTEGGQCTMFGAVSTQG